MVSLGLGTSQFKKLDRLRANHLDLLRTEDFLRMGFNVKTRKDRVVTLFPHSLASSHRSPETVSKGHQQPSKVSSCGLPPPAPWWGGRVGEWWKAGLYPAGLRVHGGGARGQGREPHCPTLSKLVSGPVPPLSPPHTIWLPEGVSPSPSICP